MATRIKIEVNALIVEDTISGNVLVEEPRKGVYYSASKLANGIILLQSQNLSGAGLIGLITVPVSDAVDATDTPFTIGSFETFARTNLGASPATPATVESLTTAETGTDKVLQPDGTGGVEFLPNVVGAFFNTTIVLDGTEAANRFIFNGSTNETITLPLESTIATDYIVLIENQATKKNRALTILTQGSDVLIGTAVMLVGDMCIIERTGVGEYTSRFFQTALSEAAVKAIPNITDAFVFFGNDWASANDFSNNAHWIYDINIIIADPGAGKLRFNNTDLSLATKIAVSDITSQGHDITNLFNIVQLTTVFWLRQFGDFSKEITFEITGIIDQTTFFEFDITVRTNTTFDGDGVELMIEVLRIPDENIKELSKFDANNAIYPSGNPAVADSRNGHPIISFDDTVAENVLFDSIIPSNYNAGNISFDIDWVAASAIIGGVTWGIEIEGNVPGGTDIDSDSFAAQQTGNSTTNGTSGIITRTTITLTQAEADAVAASDSYRVRVQRIVSDGGDTMVGDAQIVKIGGRV